MSFFNKNKSRVLIAAALAVVIIVFAVWQPPLLQKMISSVMGVSSISEKDFIPVDMNKRLTDSQARLLVVTDFHAAKLMNDRSLYIYLPPGYYENADRRFPVLYVHDGKAVFDVSDWSNESLNMHVTADLLISQGKISEVIIVGIASTGANRIAEYALWDGVEQGAQVHGLGQYYEDFVLNDVKPFVDRNFRTLPDRENTALMGASIGGLSTFNIGFRHPEVFSKLAMQSAYLGWGDNKLYDMLSGGPYKEKQDFKIYMDVGSAEGGFIDMTAQGLFLLLQNGYRYGEDIAAYEAPGGAHSEKYWGERVESILLYFYGDIGKPQAVTLYTERQYSLSDQYIHHLNPVVTYDSGFKLTEVLGSYAVGNPEILRMEDDGGGIYPKGVGSTEVTFTTSTGLTAKETLTVVK